MTDKSDPHFRKIHKIRSDLTTLAWRTSEMDAPHLLLSMYRGIIFGHGIICGATIGRRHALWVGGDPNELGRKFTNGRYHSCLSCRSRFTTGTPYERLLLGFSLDAGISFGLAHCSPKYYRSRSLNRFVVHTWALFRINVNSLYIAVTLTLESSTRLQRREWEVSPSKKQIPLQKEDG